MTRWLEHSPLSTMTWVDAVDILLLAWLLYRIFLLLRGTRALRSLIGVGLLVGVYFASGVFGLSAVNWLLDNLSLYLAIALLILFQDDVRNAFAQAGGTFFQRSGRRADAQVVEEVTRAVFLLARKRIGAIIALERLASLDPYVEGANALDARVSKELLLAIFHHNSPLHDGAVVIRADRVVAAGCFLPLTLSKDISRAFGTRHRAAIGLTEGTDALCLVVSEERGTVSLIRDGQVIPIADENDLRGRIQEGMGQERLPRPAEVGA
jgi:diadenylate cyclase